MGRLAPRLLERRIRQSDVRSCRASRRPVRKRRCQPPKLQLIGGLAVPIYVAMFAALSPHATLRRNSSSHPLLATERVARPRRSQP